MDAHGCGPHPACRVPRLGALSASANLGHASSWGEEVWGFSSGQQPLVLELLEGFA